MSLLAAIGSYVISSAPEVTYNVHAIGNESTGAVTAATPLTVGAVIDATGATFSTALGEPSFLLNNGYIDIEQENYSSSSMPWTASWWHYPTSTVGRMMFLHSVPPGLGDGYASFRVQMATGSTGFRYRCLYSISNAVWTDTDFTDNVGRPLNQWYHFAVTWTGTQFKFFVNGVLSASTGTLLGNVRTGRHIIGAGPSKSGYSSTDRYTGHLKDFIYVDNQVLYTTNFTPPARTA